MVAAVKRLSHFGVHKTTLAEIADDLGITKQALLYYFADKQTLIKAVLDYIAKEYLQSLSKHLSLAKDFEEVLVQLVETRYAYLRKYYMVLCEFIHNDAPKTSDLISLKAYLHQQEQQALISFFNDALSVKEVRPTDAKSLVNLVQETLDAFAQSANPGHKIPEEKQIKEMMQKQKEIVRLIYRGIAA